MRGAALRDTQVGDRGQHAVEFDCIHAARVRALAGAAATLYPGEFALNNVPR
jgi:hypothetical protein